MQKLHPGKVRIRSDGLPQDTFVEVMNRNGDWQPIGGVASLAVNAEPGQYVEVTIKFLRVELDIVAYRVRDLAETPRLRAEEQRVADERFNASEDVNGIR